jgi:MFS family permease
MAPATVLRVFLPFAAGYFLSYLYRSINAVIAPDLSASMGLDAATLGLLTSAYFLTFAAFQLPLGVLLDRYGARRVEAVLLLFAALGAFLFWLGETPAALIAGRAFIGLGVSACLMAAFKAFVVWFRSERLPLVNGCVMAAGGLGALTATAPVEALLHLTDWRGLFFILGVATLVVAALIFVVVPNRDDSDGDGSEELRRPLRGVTEVFHSPLFWRIAPVTTVSQASFLSIQGLWVGPWLTDVGGLNRTAAAGHLLVIAAAMVAGFLIMGGITERLARLGVRPVNVAGTGMFLFLLSLSAIVLEAPLPPLVLWVGFGFFGTTGILSYAILSQRFPSALAGRVNTSLNLLVFVTAFLGQWGIGAVIGLWPTTDAAGYASEGYRAGFAVALGLLVLAFLWLVLPRRDTNARF